MRKKKIKDDSSLKYKGTVSVSTLKGNKVITSKKYSNNGEPYLFEFLGKCLSGRYAEADAIRPRYIHLWSLGEEGRAVPDPLDIDVNAESSSLTNFFYKETPKVSIDREENKGVIKFSFLIPYTQIISNTINLITLHPNSNTDTRLAYFVVTDEEDKNILGNLIEANTNNKNQYNLFIEWSMTISN